jgi:hypothetical protein
MPATCIHPEKLRAYLATAYRLGHTDQEIVLTIGQRSDPLAALFDGHGVDCGAFITAYNPYGTQQSDALNQQAHALLATRLTGRGLTAIEGSGGEPGSDWPDEHSYFALGMGLDEARSFGTEFGQDAIVWVGRDAIPELILLR